MSVSARATSWPVIVVVDRNSFKPGYRVFSSPMRARAVSVSPTETA